MVDTVVSIPNLQTEFFQDGQAAGSITPQYMRNLILSLGTAQGVRVVIAGGAITHLPTDRVIIVNQTVAAAVTVNLIASPATGQAITIKDGAGKAAANPITIVPSSGTIDGFTSIQISQNYGCYSVVFNGTNWSIVTQTQAQTGTFTPGRPGNLFGLRGAATPAFHTFMGFYPEFSNDNSYMGLLIGDGQNPTTNGTYPMILNVSVLDAAAGATTYTGAAAGTYNTIYTNFAAALVSNNVAQYTYALRINPEWSGPTSTYASAIFSGSPSSEANRIVTPAQFTTAFQFLSAAIKANPGTSHIKIVWDYPCQCGDTAVTIDSLYYPGDTYVDIIACDTYFILEFGGNTIAQYNYLLSSAPYNLNQWAAFAALHNKPMGCVEWADDGNGACSTAWINFMNANNFVFNAYWNSSAGNGNGGFITNASVEAAIVAAWANTAYTGNYWPTGKLALPVSKPTGY